MWAQLNLKKKILCLFLPLVLISILLILTISTSLIVHTNKKKSLQNAQDKLTLITRQTEETIENIKYNIKAFSTSSALQNAIKSNYSEDSYGTYLFSASMQAAVNSTMDIDTFVLDGYIHTYDNKVFHVNSTQISYEPTESQLARYQYISSQGGKILLSERKKENNQSAFVLEKSLIDIETGKCLGILTFQIKEQSFYNVYQSMVKKFSEDYLIMSESGTVISSKNRNLLVDGIETPVISAIQDTSKKEHIVTTSKGKFVLLASPLNPLPYSVVYMMDYHAIFNEAYHLLLILLLIGIVLIVATIVLSLFLSQSITHPLSILTAYTEEIGSGNLDATLDLSSDDEIGILALHFKEMIGNIKELTVRLCVEQATKRDYELKLLQSQMNPHFLYNCLDSISALIHTNENDTADRMVHHLGRYYRTVLSKGRNIITFQEELHLIRDFLEIQLLKSPGLFTYHIYIEDTLKDCHILKMLLQPIVENSILHGFSSYTSGRFIEIHVSSKEHAILVTVSDNGTGISDDMMEDIFIPSNVALPKHFGLKNVRDRIQLRFGEAYGLSIFSPLAGGTTVTLHFPEIL